MMLFFWSVTFMLVAWFYSVEPDDYIGEWTEPYWTHYLGGAGFGLFMLWIVTEALS